MGKLYTVKEIAELLQVNQRTVRTWLSKKTLKHIKLASNTVRITQEQLDEFLLSKEVK